MFFTFDQSPAKQKKKKYEGKFFMIFFICLLQIQLSFENFLILLFIKADIYFVFDAVGTLFSNNVHRITSMEKYKFLVQHQTPYHHPILNSRDFKAFKTNVIYLASFFPYPPVDKKETVYIYMCVNRIGILKCLNVCDCMALQN